MKRFTLRETCMLCGVSRRAVQGYEHYGLVCPCGKTDRGYLLYDEDAVERIRFIKSLQNCGFSVREIAGYQELTGAERRTVLMRKKEMLCRKRDDIERYIAEIETMIENVD